jgi:GNAT superfamily N-acetyltransferase
LSELIIRTATRIEVELMLDWAAAEGWNPGHNDAEPFHAADGEGYLIGLVDGEPIACISVVSYGEAFSFLGFFICRPDFRGRGHGMAIWKAGIERLGSRTIGLDGVVEQQPNYIKSGFRFAHRNIRFGGVASGGNVLDPHLSMVNVSGASDAIVTYDRQFFPSERERFLRAWIAPPHRTLAYFDGTTILGYGTIRACREGHKIGPLFADDAPIAETLFSGLTAPWPGEKVFLDVPEPNTAGIGLAYGRGMEPIFETARMYRGKAPALPLDRIFGITTFELG